MVVIPENPDKLEAALGDWLKTHLQEGPQHNPFPAAAEGHAKRLLRPGTAGARPGGLPGHAVAARQNRSTASCRTKFQNELSGKLKSRFDRFAVLDIWNFADPPSAASRNSSHGAQGDKIPDAMDKIIRQDVFIPEEFEDYVSGWPRTESVGKLLKDLREPRPGGKPCIPWLGEVEVKERVIRMCAAGQIAINLRGMELLQARPAKTEDNAWNRMKGKLGTGKHLDETTLHKPDAVVISGGKTSGRTSPTGNGSVLGGRH